MSNHSAGYLVNNFLRKFINEGYMDRFNEEEKYKIEQIFESVVRGYDGNVYEMLDGLEEYFGLCECCHKRKNAEEMNEHICSKCKEEDMVQ